jgi:ribosomal protein S18 acetylase RimI-like enzyme
MAHRPGDGAVTPADVAFRAAEPADAQCLSALATQVFFETYATSGIRVALVREAESQFSVAAIVERLHRPEGRTTLAERDGHLIAFAEIVLGATHRLVPQHDAAELTRLYVQSPFLRRGVGRRLLAHAEALASTEGASTLWLTAWVGNARALAFYASRGYKALGSTPYAFEGEVFENTLFAKALGAGQPAR